MARRDDSGAVKKLAVGALIAAVVGYLAGILTAPKSGKETREDIKDTATKAASESEQRLRELRDQLDELVDDLKDRGYQLSDKAQDEFDRLVDTATTSREKIQDLTKSVLKGKADDKDLQKAIKDAQKAVDHLKGYLKK